MQNDANYQLISDSSFYTQVSLLLISLSLVVYSLIYCLIILLKQTFLRQLPNRKQWLNLLRLSPFLLFDCLLSVSIFFSTNKESFAAVFFSIIGLSIILMSLISLILPFCYKNGLSAGIRHVLIAIVVTTMGLYLYCWGFTSQPIWS